MNPMDQSSSFFTAPNIIIKDLFAEEEFNIIKHSFNSDVPSQHVPHLGYWAYHVRISDELIKRLNLIASDLMNQDMVLSEYQLATYMNYYLDDVSSQPLLFPHVDNTFEEPRFSIDCLIESNIEWPLLIDSNNGIKELMPSVNEAMTFSGTHQVHWRPKREFNDDEFIRLMFLHFKPANQFKIPKDHYDSIRQKQKELREKWDNEPGSGIQNARIKK